MRPDDIVLKYCTYQPKNILEAMPLHEATEIIKAKLRDEVSSELESEYEDRIYAAEEEAADWESLADDYEGDAIQLATAVQHALDAGSFVEAKEILEMAKRDFNRYF